MKPKKTKSPPQRPAKAHKRQPQAAGNQSGRKILAGPPAPTEEQLYSVNALSKHTGRDRRTLDKILVGVTPAKVSGATKLYRLSDLQATIAAKPDKALKEDKLAEEIRKLKLRNDREERKLILRAEVTGILTKIYGELTSKLDQKLEMEYPAILVGLDIPNLRVKLKQLNDEIRAFHHSAMQAFPE